MRIVTVIPSFIPNVGGVIEVAENLGKELIKKGYEIVVYTGGDYKLKKEEVLEGFYIKRFKPEIVAKPYNISSKMFLSLLKEKADIIHSHHYGYYPATAGFLAAKITGTPHIFSTYYHPPLYGTFQKSLFATYHVTQGFYILRFSDRVLSMTNYETKFLRSIGAKKDKIDIIPGVVNTKIFKPSRKISKEEDIILFIGTLSKSKGIDIAFDIAMKFIQEKRDVRFVFIGREHFDEDLLKKCLFLKGRKEVTFLKDISDKQLVYWFNKTSIFILPSRYEAFSLVLAQAQACETPVVASNVGGVSEVVSNSISGFLCDGGNVLDFKGKIEILLDNKKLRKKMGRRGRNHIVKNFDTKIVSKKLIKIYEDVI